VHAAADDLDMIDHRIADLAAAADDVNTLASNVRSDATLVQDSAQAIDVALTGFFERLPKDRAG